MFASSSFSSVINNTDIVFSSSSVCSSSTTSSYASPPGSPYISLLNSSIPNVTTPIIGQKRSQRNSSTKASVSPSFSSNNMNSLLKNPTYLYDTSSLPKTPTTCTSTPSGTSSTMPSSTIYTPSTTPSSSSSSKIIVPKSPKPQRTLLILDSVLTGLSLCIDDLKSKVSDLSQAVTNGYTAMTKQLLQSEAYLRHLEMRISNLQKLKNSYSIHLKMKDGIQNMYDAYKKSPSRNQVKNLANIKAGWKECVHTLCLIEAQTEALLGTFRFQIEKLIGFARLCPGDLYELQIKYGNSSKFRTRTKISKDCAQQWDSLNFSFKITVHDSLLIKINEIKFFGKNISIGERIFDTKDLFSTTQTQRLTLNANTSGTIKLSMLITWLPFENCEDTFLYYNPTQFLTLKKDKRPSLSSSSSFSSNSNSNQSDFVTPGNNTTLQIRPNTLQFSSNLKPSANLSNLSAIIDNDDDSFNNSSSTSSSSSLELASCSKKEDNRLSLQSDDEIASCFNTTSQSISNQSLDDVLPEVELLMSDLLDQIEFDSSRSLNECLYSKLKSTIDELRSFYIELNDFYNILTSFQGLFEIVEEDSLNNESSVNTTSHESNESINMDDVLHEYFDFLNLENDSDLSVTTEQQSQDEELINLKCEFNKSFDYDQMLYLHFKVILKLLEDLNFVSKNQVDDLRSKQEIVLINKLSQEFDILKKIRSILKNDKEPSNKETLIELIDPSLKSTWLKLLENDEAFYCCKIKNFDKLLQPYLAAYSLNGQNDKFISVFYFSLLNSYLNHLTQFLKELDYQNEDKFWINLIVPETLLNKFGFLNQIFLNDIINSGFKNSKDVSLQKALSNFINLNKSSKIFCDLLVGLLVEKQTLQDKDSKTVDLISFLQSHI